MTAMHLLEGLREDGVTFYPEPGDVIRLVLPQGQRLHGLPAPGRSWSLGLYALVQQHDEFVHVLTDCAQMSLPSAEPLAWAMLIAGYAGPRD